MLIADYQRVGKFQWVDDNAVYDSEELYLNPLSAVIIVAGTFSILYQLNFGQHFILGGLKKIIITPICIIYAVISIIIGSSVLLIILSGAIMESIHSLYDFAMGLTILLFFASLATAGFLTVYKMYKEFY